MLSSLRDPLGKRVNEGSIIIYRGSTKFGGGIMFDGTLWCGERNRGEGSV